MAERQTDFASIELTKETHKLSPSRHQQVPPEKTLAEKNRQTLKRKVLDIGKIPQIRIRLESDKHRLFPTERLIEKSDHIDK